MVLVANLLEIQKPKKNHNLEEIDLSSSKLTSDEDLYCEIATGTN